MSKTVVFVDSDGGNQLLMGRIVAHAGHRGRAAAGFEAVEPLVREGCDLLLLTITGRTAPAAFDLVRRLKGEEGAPLIIAVMRERDSGLKPAGFLAGCDGHLPKPADIRQIQALLAETLVEAAALPNETVVAAG